LKSLRALALFGERWFSGWANLRGRSAGNENNNWFSRSFNLEYKPLESLGSVVKGDGSHIGSSHCEVSGEDSLP